MYMRMALCAVLAVALCGAAWNDGAIHSDSFDLPNGSKLKAGWTQATRDRWRIKSGSAVTNLGTAGIYGTPLASADCAVITFVHGEVSASGGVIARANSTGASGYIATIGCLDTKDHIQLYRREPGNTALLARVELKAMAGISGYVKLVCRGSRLRVYHDDVLYIDVTDSRLTGRYVGMVVSPTYTTLRSGRKCGLSQWVVKP